MSANAKEQPGNNRVCSSLESVMISMAIRNKRRYLSDQRASQVALVVKNLAASAGDVKDMGSIPGSGGSPGKGNGNPLQYSCQENPLDRGAW